MKMSTRVNIDGRTLPVARAVISVFDRGFLYGDSVYEVQRTYGGRPFAPQDHIERLERSAARIGMELPAPPRRIARWLDATLRAARNDESYIRIVVTRGAGPIRLDPAAATRGRTIIIVKPLELPPMRLYRAGARVAIVSVQRNPKGAIDPEVKSGNYLNNILALREARARGAYEALMLNDRGKLCEGASSNLFLVRGGRLFTPPLSAGILEGITRRYLLRWAREEGIEGIERNLTPGDLVSADEAFLTSSIREVLPVSFVDDQPIGTGRPGPVTRRLQRAFRARAGAMTREEAR